MCFPWLKPYSSSKLEPRSHPCCFLGYCPHSKGYRCLDMSSSKVYISRHVTFLESEFPFATSPIPPSSSQNTLHFRELFYAPLSHQNHLSSMPSSGSPTPPSSIHSFDHLQSPNMTTAPSTSSSSHSSPSLPPLHPMITRSRAGIYKPRVPFSLHTTPTASVDPTTVEPHNFQQASKCREWSQAMNDEYSAPMHQQAWTLVDPPTDCNVIGCK